jgi:vacuole morphology and inheritance protein 14
MTVNMLIQVDKLVQLIESPVFTYLRLQLLEPEKFPYLYKCMYGILMLLPQSSAFAALKNRLNSVSSIGYLHVAPKSSASASTSSNFDRPNRLKGREDGSIRWVELLEKFRSVQERAKRAQRLAADGDDTPVFNMNELRLGEAMADVKGNFGRGVTAATPTNLQKEAAVVAPPAPPIKKSGLGRQFGRLGGAVAGKSRRN